MKETTNQQIRNHLKISYPGLLYISRKSFHDKKEVGCRLICPHRGLLHNTKSGEEMLDYITTPGTDLRNPSTKLGFPLFGLNKDYLEKCIQEIKKRIEYYSSERGRRDHPRWHEKYLRAALLELAELKGEV